MTQQYVLFSTGKTPAVITETLFGLWKEKEISGGRIHILTTSAGAAALAPLLGEQGAVAHFNRDYQTAWRIPKKWQPTEGGIEVLTDGNEKIEDLRTTRHNNIAADRIAAIVRDWTDQREDVTLHASLAGGRRTMGVFLAQAMSWFARPGDDLYHVTVDPLKEADPNWFYPAPDNRAEQKLVQLAEQPFVRMRGVLAKLVAAQITSRSYSDLVELSQICLSDQSLDKLEVIFDTNKQKLTIFIDSKKSKSDSKKSKSFDLKFNSSLMAGLYLFLCKYANEAEGQEKFYFEDAFDYRDKIAECLDVFKARERYEADEDKWPHGLSAFHRAIAESEEWPPEWRIEKGEYDGKSCDEWRKKALTDGFNNLKERVNIWPNASFGIQGINVKKGKGAFRYVNIPNITIRRHCCINTNN